MTAFALPRVEVRLALPAATGGPRVRRVAVVLEGVLLGLVFAVLAGAVLPPLLGHKVLSVLSGSMEPAIGTGDAVLVQQISPRAMRIGDVVTFRDPTDQGRLITHRVRGLTFRDNRAAVTTKGDANTGVERWSVPTDGQVGLVRNKLPHLGEVFVWTRTAPGRIGLVVVPALLLTLGLLRRIWRPEAPATPEQPPAAPVLAAQTAVARDARSVTVAAPAAAPGDRLSAVALLGDRDVTFIAPVGWKLIDDRTTAAGRLLRYAGTARVDADAHTFRASRPTSISVSVVGYGAAA